RAQHDLALRVCAQAGLTPDQIGYLEAHGTGTAAGDAIELAALGEAYGRAESRSHPLLVGSVKAAIGRLEAAAGVAGVMKAPLALHHRTIHRNPGWTFSTPPSHSPSSTSKSSPPPRHSRPVPAQRSPRSTDSGTPAPMLMSS